MLKLIDSLVVSNIVLNILINDFRFCDIKGFIELFENGRYQGYKLVYLKNKSHSIICFSQNKNSDDIVVFFSDIYESVNYSDNFWQTKKYFKFNEYYLVVDYIYELVINEN